jgi:hypothetical protein
MVDVERIGLTDLGFRRRSQRVEILLGTGWRAEKTGVGMSADAAQYHLRAFQNTRADTVPAPGAVSVPQAMENIGH